MPEDTETTDEPNRSDAATQNNQISTARRLAPQIIVATIKNLIILNKSLFDGFSTIVIPALSGITAHQNPNETIQITPVESSWLSMCTYIGHPFGSLLSGFISDALGRRRALMLVVAPAVIAFIMLGLAESFEVIFIGFLLLSFIFGLKDAPSVIYVSEVSEPSVRGILLSMTPIAGSLGNFTVNILGSFLSWRQVSLAVSILPIIIVTAMWFIPESPNWLLSKNRPRAAQKSLQWLRGWISADGVQDEFTRLENHIASVQTACEFCAEQPVRCGHVKAKFSDKINELRRKRTLKPFILANSLSIFMEFCAVAVMRPYIIQIVKAYGIPLDAHFTATTLSLISIVGNCCFLILVRVFGKRRLYLASTAVAILCCLGLSIYGYVFFPPNWTSFKKDANAAFPNFDLIRGIVGNYGYLAVALLFAMQFCSNLGLTAVPSLIHGEVFSMKLRSFLCGLTLAIRYGLAALATKTFLNVEMWLTMPGAILFYGMISLVGLIMMFFILPETEQRSLEDIELHYADDLKKITDIHILINNKNK